MGYLMLIPLRAVKRFVFVRLRASVRLDLRELVQPALCALHHAELEHIAVVRQKPEGGNKFRLKFSNRYRPANCNSLCVCVCVCPVQECKCVLMGNRRLTEWLYGRTGFSTLSQLVAQLSVVWRRLNKVACLRLCQRFGSFLV